MNLLMLAFGFLCIYWALVVSLDTFSVNKWDKSSSFFPAVEAKLNFYQDRLWSKSYSSSGSSFWSSPEYYNQSFDTVKVIHGNEVDPNPTPIWEIITRISRNSH